MLCSCGPTLLVTALCHFCPIDVIKLLSKGSLDYSVHVQSMVLERKYHTLGDGTSIF